TTAASVGETASPDSRLPRWVMRAVIWGLFLVGMYLIRDFFFTAFLTFLFCYLILAVVGRAMSRLSPDRDRPGLRRALVLCVFVVVPLVLLVAGFLVGPRLLDQGQRAAAWFGSLDAETEAARLLEHSVSTSEFAREYGAADDPRYTKALEEF